MNRERLDFSTASAAGDVTSGNRTGGIIEERLLAAVEDRETTDGRFGTTDDGRSATAVASSGSDDTTVAVVLAAEDQGDTNQFASDTEVTIWVGAYDDSGELPVELPDETLDVTAERPDGETHEESVETDEYGSASVSYDLSESGREAGSYIVTVEKPDGPSATTVFEAGLVVERAPFLENVGVHTGVESTFTFLARDGESSVPGVELDLRVTRGDETVEESTETTDDSGFATISFTPDEPDTYEIVAEYDDEEMTSLTVSAAEVTCGTPMESRLAAMDEENTYVGYLHDASGPVAAATVDFQLSESSGGDTVVDRTITTNEGGFFAVDYELAEDLNTTSLDAEIEKDGQEVPTAADWVQVDDPDDDEPAPEVVVSLSADDIVTAPGEDIEFEVEATDDGEAITDADVEFFFQYSTIGPPVYSASETTDESGTATVTVSVPENAPDGTSLRGGVLLEYEDDQYTNSRLPTVRRYEFEPLSASLTPGGEATFEMEVTDVATDEPADGISQNVVGKYTTAWDGTFGSGKLVSGSDGTDEMSFSVPEDVQFRESIHVFDRYGRFTDTFRPDHPGDVSVSGSAVPGEDIALEIDAPGDPELSGIAFIFSFSPFYGFGVAFDGDETPSLRVPDHFEEGDPFGVSVWAVDEDGTLHADGTTVEIDEGTELSVSASGDSIPVGGEAEIDVSASSVERVTVEALWLDWDDLADVELDGGTSENRVAEDGTYEIEWDEIEASVSSSITVEPPEDTYVGGTYQVTVTGTDGEETDSDTAVLEIE